MPCYTPLVGVDVGVRAETGKRVVRVIKGSRLTEWNRKHQHTLPLPCGKCIGCRLERSRQWAIRCVHEASLHQNNIFITLTFNEENEADHGSLVKSDFQLFMKRLRKFNDYYVWREDKHEYVQRWKTLSEAKIQDGIRYYHCGEYGEKLGRPHHHACIFNFDFKDKTIWDTRNGVRLYRSKSLERLWTFGYSTIGEVTFESAAYVARYITKKINGPKTDSHYGDLLPEYTTMSRRPGIAAGWYDRYGKDVYEKDEVAIKRNGKIYISKPPKYYDKLIERSDPGKYEIIKKDRIKKAEENQITCDKLKVKHEIAQRAFNRNKRDRIR